MQGLGKESKSAAKDSSGGTEVSGNGRCVKNEIENIIGKVYIIIDIDIL